MIKVQEHAGSVSFPVRVHPKAKRDRISGVWGEALKLELTAPPIDGKANEACIRFFADFLKVARSSVTIAAGLSSRNKAIRVTGVSAIKVEQILTAALAEPAD